MRHEKVDRVPRLAAVILVEVPGARKAGSQLAGRHRLDPELILRPAERIAEVIVPLGPTRGEIALLLATVPGGGPRLGYQVHPRPAARRADGQLPHRAI